MAARGQLVQIPANLLEFFWPQAEPWLRAAVEKYRLDPIETFRERLERRQCDLWLVYINNEPRAAFVTSVRGRVLTGEILGGVGVDDWFASGLEDLEAVARENGIERLRMDVRRGLAPRLPDYRVVAVSVEKVL